MNMITKIYKKDGICVARPTYVQVNDLIITMPTDEDIVAAGYEIVEEETIIVPAIPTYEELVVRFIREQYDQDAEFAILRQRDTKPEEFQEYYEYCEECKTRAKEMTNG